MTRAAVRDLVRAIVRLTAAPATILVSSLGALLGLPIPAYAATHNQRIKSPLLRDTFLKT